MPFSQGSYSRLAIAPQIDFDTPGTVFAALPFNTHSLELTKERVQGNEINPDRMPRVDRHGNRSAGGDIVCDLRGDDFDTMLESAMLSAWSTNVLKVGKTAKFFTIEDYASDVDQARLFTGMHVNTLNVSIAPNQMVVTTFGMVGKDMSIGAIEKTVSAATSNQPFDSYSGTIEIANAGSSVSEINNVSSLEFTLDNGLNPAFVVGSASAGQLIIGDATVEGTITFYYDGNTIINRFLNETETALEVTVGDPGSAHTHTFFFPRIKINGAAVPVEGPDQARFVTAPFVALYDTTAESNLSITRTYA